MPAEIKIEPTGVTFALPGSRDPLFRMPAIDARGLESVPALFARGAADQVADLAEERAKVYGDAYLSDTGKAVKLAPAEEKALDMFARGAEAMLVEGRSLDSLDAELTAVPRLGASETVAAAEDVEIRSWWRQLPSEERTKLLDRIDKEPGHERLMVALLRQPVPMSLDHEVAFVRDVWRRTARLNDPAKAVKVDEGRAWLEWGRRGLLQAVGAAQTAVNLKPAQLLQFLAAADKRDAAKFFGFDRFEFERTKQAIEHQRRRAA